MTRLRIVVAGALYGLADWLARLAWALESWA